MREPQRVCAVVLTYNRQTLLRECLDALAAQAHAPDHVLVVDNASTDGTSEMLRAEYPGVQVCSLPHNAGAAGGFHACLEAAHALGFEWIWLMDDDVIPQPGALAALLDKAGELGGDLGLGFVCSRVVGTNGASMNVPDLDHRYGANLYPEWDTHLALGVVRLRRATFVSILLPRAAVQEAGLPLRDLYIFGEDTEYTLRITQKRPAYLVGASVVVHKRALQGPLDIARETNPARLPYYFHLLRNDIYLARRFYGKEATLRLCLRSLLRVPRLLALPQGPRRAALVLRAVVAGLRFQPRPETVTGVLAPPHGALAQTPLAQTSLAQAAAVQTPSAQATSAQPSSAWTPAPPPAPSVPGTLPHAGDSLLTERRGRG